MQEADNVDKGAGGLIQEANNDDKGAGGLIQEARPTALFEMLSNLWTFRFGIMLRTSVTVSVIMMLV